MSSSIHSIDSKALDIMKIVEEPKSSPSNHALNESDNVGLEGLSQAVKSEDKMLADDFKEKNSFDDEVNELSLERSLSNFFDEISVNKLQLRSLEFSVGEYKGRAVVKVIDKENDEVIRQIPSEDFIKMTQKIDMLSDEMHKAKGVLLDSKV